MSIESTGTGENVQGMSADAGSAASSSVTNIGGDTASGAHAREGAGTLLSGYNAQQSSAHYDLKVPEGIDWTHEVSSAFAAQAHELNLDANGAQKLLDMSHKNHMLMKQNHEKQVAAWRDEVQADKDIGGAALESTVNHAKATLTRFDKGGKLFHILEQTGYANHPDILRFLAAVGREHAEDSVVLGGGSYASVPRHERMYGKYNN